ncbi:uncharacterized protein (PEP-CTERM system associated) [Nitrosospira sp. Nsp2]|uniref:TIGR03016 family PEP-CTERM system-associated outer membrane protein n=1 Tax=Nitrosospira sp. Nsp2 TaxID=136548 RepID=UPI000D3103C5|nr:TIGR03016 family PEP-CTERM system-associated outer membrane protein [Nitrosospira sp. Nsp2]PTR15174.1 uncharacterized protein (PEP-CTERM system associated) [Nitrosospira sp. Nsp2]
MKALEDERCRSGSCAAAFGAVAMLLFAPFAGAADWRVLPRMSLSETYTDNVRLGGGFGGGGGFGTTGKGGEDFVTQINPGVFIRGQARRFNVDLDYTMNNLIYAENGNLTRMRHQLNAAGTGELIKDLFFVDGRASIIQQNISLLGPQAISNVNATGNRADVRTLSVSPYLRHRFGNLATGEVRFLHNEVTSNTSFVNSSANAYTANINSGDAFRILAWGLNYSNQTIEFTRSGREAELERSFANLRYAVTPQFSLTATGGYERNTFLSIRGKNSSPTWSVGFMWQPNERTNIALTGGQRFFGDTYNAVASYRTRLTVWDASYDENITTFNQQAQQGAQTGFGSAGFAGGFNQLITAQNPGLNPGLIQQGSGGLLGMGLSGSFFDPTNFLTNRLFLQKRFQASFALNGLRNTFVVRGFNMTRQALSAAIADEVLPGVADLSLLNHTRQTGGNVLWSYRLSQRNRANFNLAYTRFSFLGANRDDDLMLASFSVVRQLQERPNLFAILEARHNRRASNQPGGDYRENAVTASLNMSF